MSAIIREATEADVFDLLVLGREFSREAGEAFQWDKIKTEGILMQAVKSDEVLILVIEDEGVVVGGLIGAVTTMPFSSHMIALSCRLPTMEQFVSGIWRAAWQRFC